MSISMREPCEDIMQVKGSHVCYDSMMILSIFLRFRSFMFNGWLNHKIEKIKY